MLDLLTAVLLLNFSSMLMRAAKTQKYGRFKRRIGSLYREREGLFQKSGVCCRKVHGPVITSISTPVRCDAPESHLLVDTWSSNIRPREHQAGAAGKVQQHRRRLAFARGRGPNRALHFSVLQNCELGGESQVSYPNGTTSQTPPSKGQRHRQ